MTLLVKLFLGFGSAATIAAGGYGTYELIRPKTIADQLKWEGKELLNVSSDNKDDEEWRKLYEKYSLSSNEDKFSKDDSITSKEGLRKKCKEVFPLLLTKENEDNLKQARFWCVKNSSKLSGGK